MAHPGPARHGNAVPGAQAPFDPRGLDRIQAHVLIVLGFDFTGGQGDNPGFVGLAVQTIRGQLGVVGMWRDHHHPATLQLDRRGYPQAQLTLQLAMPAAQAQRAGLQWRSKPRQVEETHAIDATLEGLPIGLLASQ